MKSIIMPYQCFFICSSDLQQGQGFHADPLDRAFLEVLGVQPVLFYLVDPLHQPLPVCGYRLFKYVICESSGMFGKASKS